MFIYQAHQAFAIWHNVLPKIDEEVEKLRNKKMIRIAVVGEIGSGKTYVAKLFGFPVFNADKEVAEIYKSNRGVYKKLKTKFQNSFSLFLLKRKKSLISNYKK